MDAATEFSYSPARITSFFFLLNKNKNLVGLVGNRLNGYRVDAIEKRHTLLSATSRLIDTHRGVRQQLERSV